MRVAMPIWENRVSTVLDFSDNLLIADIKERTVVGETSINWSLCNEIMKISLLTEEGVSVLLCGAVSKPLQIMLEDSGIDLVYGLRGMKDVVLQAYLNGTLQGDCFRLPGTALTVCPGNKRKRCRSKGLKPRDKKDLL